MTYRTLDERADTVSQPVERHPEPDEASFSIIEGSGVGSGV